MGKKYWRAMATSEGGFSRDVREAYEVGRNEILAYRVEVRVRGIFPPREQCTYTLIAREPIRPETHVSVSSDGRKGMSGACQVKTPGADLYIYNYYIFEGVEEFAAEIRNEVSGLAHA